MHQNFKGLRQGCVIPFRETEAVKAALPQKLGERGTHSHIQWQGNIYGVWVHRLHLSVFPFCPCSLSHTHTHKDTYPTQYTQPLALKRIPTVLILILLGVFAEPAVSADVQPNHMLTSGPGSTLACLWTESGFSLWAQLVLYSMIQTEGVMGRM